MMFCIHFLSGCVFVKHQNTNNNKITSEVLASLSQTMYVDIHVNTTPSSFTKISGAICHIMQRHLVHTQLGTNLTTVLLHSFHQGIHHRTHATLAGARSAVKPVKPVKPRFMWCICIVKNTNFYNCLHLCGFLTSLHRCLDFGGCQRFGFCCICTLKIRIMKHRKKENTSFLDSPHIFFTTKKSFAKLQQFARFTSGSLLVPLISSMIPLMLALGYAKPLDPFQCNSSMVKAIAAHVVPVQSRPDNENAKASSHALNLALQKMHHK